MKDPDKSKDNSRPSALRVRVVSLVIALGVAGVLAGAFFYHYIVSGGLRARQTPSTLETAVAQKLVNLSIPNDVKTLTNPLDKRPDGAAVAAGHELYQKNCEVCHGYDGTGKTVAGGGLYPPPLDLSQAGTANRNRTDGELFYFIRNGVRNTAMPGWQLPDQQTWQLVAYIRNLPKTASLNANAPATTQESFGTTVTTSASPPAKRVTVPFTSIG